MSITENPPSSRKDQAAAGRALRKAVPRKSLGTLDSPSRDAVALVASQNADRVQDLVPIRKERMSESAFAFYRGAALVMATDLQATPSTGVEVQSCGDAHVANFGVFGSREAELIFDVNDFDETAPAPWEWDIKRLVTSIVIAAQHVNLSKKQERAAATATAYAYRTAMNQLAQLTAAQRFYLQLDADDLVKAAEQVGSKAGKATKRGLKKARSNTSQRALKKLGVKGKQGNWQIAPQPPLIDRLPEFDADYAHALADAYRKTVTVDVALLLAQYSFQDAVVKVVGVGSVGTRCFLVLFTDPDGQPLFLQIKEAGISVLDQVRALDRASTDGARRVVDGQRIMQAGTDPFLGWFTPTSTNGAGRSYYVRMFRDMKGSLDLETVDAGGLEAYGKACAIALARAHAQSGTPATIAGYLGGGTKQGAVEEALADFGQAYAEQNARDFAALKKSSKKTADKAAA